MRPLEFVSPTIAGGDAGEFYLVELGKEIRYELALAEGFYDRFRARR
jgi:hypothetical protein